MQIRIPVNCVPRAYVDYDGEARQILGQDLVLADGFRVPPVTPARLIALELVESGFFLHAESCDMVDAAIAVVLISCERSAVAELTSDRDKLLAAAGSWLCAHVDALVADYAKLCSWILVIPFHGFNMLPRNGSGPGKPFWFDGAFAGSVLAAASKILATPFDAILWHTPLCTVWHAIAQHEASLGVKGVERPPDKRALKTMMDEAAAREARGELHPWQYADPFAYRLTDAQAQANPALIPWFRTLRAEFEKNGRRPLDPAAFPPPVPETPSANEVERTVSVEEDPHHGK